MNKNKKRITPVQVCRWPDPAQGARWECSLDRTASTAGHTHTHSLTHSDGDVAGTAVYLTCASLGSMCTWGNWSLQRKLTQNGENMQTPHRQWPQQGISSMLEQNSFIQGLAILKFSHQGHTTSYKQQKL